MRATLLGILGGGTITLLLLALGGLAGYGYAHWEADFDTSLEKTMDDVTAACVGRGGFSYKGYGYHCTLDEEGKRDLADAVSGDVKA
jgi:hypothetical protein